MKKIITFLKEFLFECQEKNLVLLSGSSSFFFFLCLIPSTLLLLNLFTFLFESITPTDTLSFIRYIETIIPNDILPSFQLVFKHTTNLMQTNKDLNLLHYSILATSSLGFFGSIWKSVYIITGEKKSGKLLTTLKSFLTIALSFGFILLLVATPLIVKFFKYLFSLKLFENLKLQELFLRDLPNLEYSGINLISALLLFAFFIFFFRFLLHGNATFKSTLVGSAVFTLSIVLTKMAFLSYLLVMKHNLISNYGHLYSFMLFLVWIYTVIFLFYAAIIFTYILSRQRFELLESPPDFLVR